MLLLDTGAMSNRNIRSVLLKAAVIVLAGFWIYLPTLQGEWLWDDDVMLLANPTVQSGSFSGLMKLWFNPEGIDYFPLTYSVLWLQWTLFGIDSTGYHVVNIFLHVMTGLLLWFLLEKMHVPGAYAAALVFTVHPVCVESVAWVAETKNTLSTCLFLSSCIFWVEQDALETGPRRERLYLCSIVFYLFAMFAKTSMVAMPVLTLLYAWWKRGNIKTQDIIRAAPLFLISIVLGLITIQFQHSKAIGGEQLPIGGLASRIAVAGMAIFFYLRTLLWPINLLPIYPQWDVSPPQLWQFVPWLIIVGVLWWLWTKRTIPWACHTLFAFGFFFLMIAPVLGFINISYMRISWVADHFLYLPMIGPLVLVVATISKWLHTRKPKEQLVLNCFAFVVILFLAGNSFFYSTAWAKEEFLWDHTLLYNPDAWQAHNRLGVKKLSKNDLRGAEYHFRNASRLRPDLGETKNNLGLTLARTGRLDEAIEIYKSAVRASPKILTIRKNLADAYMELGKYEEASIAYQQILNQNPDDAFILNLHAIALFKLGNIQTAIREFRRVLELEPNFDEALESLKVASKKLEESQKKTPRVPDSSSEKSNTP